ncbi:peptidase [Sulfitobacter sp. M57]|uniref:NlpC/P60 family protein n=1 Tax=unclassified Sulfitobacter TaxID=196795 RepID=UPI0023E2B14A|nr:MULTISPECIES: NlpC/P60 family protein [unclassified Sulfitobacter]MDF3413449.1 peptidase [Sulfitobacter sp. KE5]MDF3421271.1 peptidase [Sulfitobacter sp. KE43]MDF3431996.1 peptidase [Sulfitobacter sp. KE42]MDF3457636.1 peptidase [Sulfitobacter sp. S74]MDF3461538.1 peptidase [Sulfitobacter sp. Ks18]
MSRAEIVAAARCWIGTPYVHQSSRLGAGCDCLGLLRGIWRDLCGQEPELVPAYSKDWSEPQGEERLWAAALRHLHPKEPRDAEEGDVLLFRMRDQGVAKHLGVQGRIGARASFIHAYTGHGVVESPLSTPWQRRIVARFEFPRESN